MYNRVFLSVFDDEPSSAEDKSDDDDFYSFGDDVQSKLYSDVRAGDSTSDYDEIVAPFYAIWASFTTRHEFYHCDKWDLREVTSVVKTCKHSHPPGSK